MQFIPKGPDIPERLLYAHEAGDVVFFCGAGISRPAGLPDFKSLREKIYDELHIDTKQAEEDAIEVGRFDIAIALLESRIVNDRENVRKKLIDILQPNLNALNATINHKALLRLGKNRDGQTHIVTTNFDRLFEKVIAEQSPPVAHFKAPLLPIPKNSWDGLIYLHGLLTEVPTKDDLNKLVISSGDFGLAYLTERWAACFVSELFRNYTVCFVGYSISDPVLRHMMDALAADHLLGGTPREMFAFGACLEGEEKKKDREWRAKNVVPILYNEHEDHSYLNKTLRAWAVTYYGGVRAKRCIVEKYAAKNPLESNEQDDFVGRLLWALSEPNGLPAKRFAELEPVPSLYWLPPLSEQRYGHADLSYFGIPPEKASDENLRFSLMSRPTPYDLAPRMAFVNNANIRGSGWDEIMKALVCWLPHHLNDPKLLFWLLDQGHHLYERLALMIRIRLDELTALEDEDNKDKLESIRKNAPNAIPEPFMRTLWELLLAGRIRSHPQAYNFSRPYYHDFSIWQKCFKLYGLTHALRLQLLEILTPCAALYPSVPWSCKDGENDASKRIKDLVRWEIELSTEYVHSALRDFDEDTRWTAALPELLSAFTTLLHDALKLMQELGCADSRSDLSYMYQPSISKDPLNKDSRNWTALIDLTRDAWLATAEQSPERAKLEAEAWSQIDYPLFRRLSFFAAAHANVIPHRVGLNWLLADERWWLWSIESEREAIRLLATLASQKIDSALLKKLEQAILDGPPREIVKGDIEDEEWKKIFERDIWLRLAKIADAGAALSADAQKRLDALTAKYPEWKLQEDQSDEFPVWIGEAQWVDKSVATYTPRSRSALIQWLKEQENENTVDREQRDDWQERCRDDFPTTAYALRNLSREDIWPYHRWREALRAWTEEKLHRRSWRYIGPVLTAAPDEVIQHLHRDIGRWLKAIAKTFEGREENFFKLARRILILATNDGIDSDDPVKCAINHPVGLVIDALLKWWHRNPFNDGQGLAEEISPIFTEFCKPQKEQIDKSQHGRVLLASHLVFLFRVDPDWTKKHLLPLFDWRREAQAHTLWQGFLWSPRLHIPLMEELKPAFLDTAHHYEELNTELGEYKKRYAMLLTFAALNPRGLFTEKELAAATRALPADGLRHAVHTMAENLGCTDDRHVPYWRNRVVRYLDNIWPKGKKKNVPGVSAEFSYLCIAAQSMFPEALDRLRPWLQPEPLAELKFLIHRLHKSGLCERFPEDALKFLDLLIDVQIKEPPPYLEECMEQIGEAAPELKSDDRLKKLTIFLCQHGQGGNLSTAA